MTVEEITFARKLGEMAIECQTPKAAAVAYALETGEDLSEVTLNKDTSQAMIMKIIDIAWRQASAGDALTRARDFLENYPNLVGEVDMRDFEATARYFDDMRSTRNGDWTAPYRDFVRHMSK